MIKVCAIMSYFFDIGKIKLCNIALRTLGSGSAVFLLIAFMFVACEKNVSDEIKYNSWHEFLENKTVYQISSFGDTLYCVCSEICLDCDVPPEMSSIPHNYYIAKIIHEDFQYKKINYERFVPDEANARLIGVSNEGIFDYTDIENIKTLNTTSLNCSNLAINPFGELWMAGYEGIFIFDGSKIDSITTSNSEIPTNRAEWIVISDNNIKWLKLGFPHHGLFRIENEKQTVFSLEDINIGNSPILSVYNLETDREGNLWATFNSKLESNIICFKNGKWTKIIPEVNNKPVKCFATLIYCDRFGNIWVLYSENPNDYNTLSILKYNGQQWQNFPTPSDNHIITIHVSQSGKIWLGTDNGIEALEWQ